MAEIFDFVAEKERRERERAEDYGIIIFSLDELIDMDDDAIAELLRRFEWESED